jgi:thioredoxin reductase (NADPH)
VHRREGFRASPIMLDRARAHPSIHILTNKTVKRWLLQEEAVADEQPAPTSVPAVLRGAELVDTRTGELSELQCAGAFLAVGHKPVTSFLAGSGIELDKEGYVVSHSCTLSMIQYKHIVL